MMLCRNPKESSNNTQTGRGIMASDNGLFLTNPMLPGNTPTDDDDVYWDDFELDEEQDEEEDNDSD